MDRRTDPKPMSGSGTNKMEVTRIAKQQIFIDEILLFKKSVQPASDTNVTKVAIETLRQCRKLKKCPTIYESVDLIAKGMGAVSVIFGVTIDYTLPDSDDPKLFERIAKRVALVIDWIFKKEQSPKANNIRIILEMYEVIRRILVCTKWKIQCRGNCGKLKWFHEFGHASKGTVIGKTCVSCKYQTAISKHSVPLPDHEIEEFKTMAYRHVDELELLLQDDDGDDMDDDETNNFNPASARRVIETIVDGEHYGLIRYLTDQVNDGQVTNIFDVTFNCSDCNEKKYLYDVRLKKERDHGVDSRCYVCHESIRDPIKCLANHAYRTTQERIEKGRPCDDKTRDTTPRDIEAEIREVLVRQEGLCAVTGWPLDTRTMSLDRKNRDNLAYIGNMRLVMDMRFNPGGSYDFTPKFVHQCLYADLIVADEPPEDIMNVFIDRLISNAKTHAKRRGALGTRKDKSGDFSLTREQVIELFRAQNGRCYLSGLPLVMIRRHEFMMSIERKNNKLGYTIDNIVLVIHRFNTPKQWTKEFYDKFRADLHRIALNNPLTAEDKLTYLNPIVYRPEDNIKFIDAENKRRRDTINDENTPQQNSKRTKCN